MISQGRWDRQASAYIESLEKSGQVVISVSNYDGSAVGSLAGGGKTLKTATGSVATIGDNSIISAVIGNRIKVQTLLLITSSTSAVTATFKDGTGGTSLYTIPLQAISGTICGVALSCGAPNFLFASSAGNLLDLNLSASISVTYSLTYWTNDSV